MPSTDSTPHWLIPFASSLSDPCQHALPHLDAEGRLPNLRALVARLGEVARSEGDEYALSMPHERVLAAELGWSVGPDTDGRLPWAHWWAAQDGLRLDADADADTGTPAAWALLTPGHWLMGREHFTLLDPQALGLDAATSQALLEALRPLFEDDGWQLRWGAPTRWYASHPALDGLPTASLDRVVGRNPDLWLSADPQDPTAPHAVTRGLRRLQAEVQMALYQHPLNDRREAEGLPTVNSFWVSGCGKLPSGQPLADTAWPEGLTLCDDLRAGLLADDMPLWVDTWQQLDATVLAELVQRLDAGRPLRLTLCGERHAVTLGTDAAAGPMGTTGAMGMLKRSWRSALQSLGARRALPLPSAFLSQL